MQKKKQARLVRDFGSVSPPPARARSIPITRVFFQHFGMLVNKSVVSSKHDGFVVQHP